jgi:hypothetical protein
VEDFLLFGQQHLSPLYSNFSSICTLKAQEPKHACHALLGIIGDGSMDRYRYYQLIPLVMLTTDSIDPLVEDFFILIDSITKSFPNQ